MPYRYNYRHFSPMSTPFFANLEKYKLVEKMPNQTTRISKYNRLYSLLHKDLRFQKQETFFVDNSEILV